MSGTGLAVRGSTLTLYAAGSSGYQAHATVLATATSDNNGSFGFIFNPASGCPSSNSNDQTYVVAAGGDAGSGRNSAIGLMALTGPCSGLKASTFVVVNELTTAAAQWAMAQFIDSTGTVMGTSSTNATGLNNAVTEAESDLVVSYLSSGGSAANVGIPATFLPSAASCSGAAAPINCDGLQRLNTLANIIAACVESNGPSSSTCSALLKNTGNSANTLAATHTIVTNPTTNLSAIFGVQSSPSTGAPFQPALSSAPGDFTLALSFAPSGAALFSPGGVALDSFGNVFVANGDGPVGSGSGGSVSELTASSGYATGLNFAPAGASFVGPGRLAIDTSGNVFATNYYGFSVSELTASSGYAMGLNFAPAGARFTTPVGIALDAFGNIFVTDPYGDYVGDNVSVSELTASSGYATGLAFDTNHYFPDGIAVSASSNVFVTNQGVADVLTAASGYATVVNLVGPGGSEIGSSIALDRSGNLFATSFTGGNYSVTELTVSSGYATGFNFAPAGASFNAPNGIALDGSGNVFVINQVGNSLSELTATSGFATGINFAPPGASFNDPLSLALDGSGNIFVVNDQGVSVAEIIGLAKPVLTPIQACLAKGQNLCTP